VKFEPGQKVYSEAGDIGEYVSQLPEGAHVVRQLFESDFEDEDREPSFARRVGALETWRRCFNEPPRALVDAIVAEKLAAAQKLRVEIHDLEAQARKLKQDEKQTKERLAEIEALRHLDDLFAGRITHYAIRTGGTRGHWGVYPHEHAMQLGSDRYDPRRLTLYCRDAKAAAWTFYGGRDSPGELSCFPYNSESAARAKVQEMITAELAEQVREFSSYYAVDIVKNALHYGVEVPAEITRKLLAEKTSHARHDVAMAEVQLSKAVAALQLLTAPSPAGETQAAPA
jgi:hypothetical protein